MNDEGSALESLLIDLTDVDLRQLRRLPDSVLAASIRHVLSESGKEPDGYLGFQSSISSPVEHP